VLFYACRKEKLLKITIKTPIQKQQITNKNKYKPKIRKMKHQRVTPKSMKGKPKVKDVEKKLTFFNTHVGMDGSNSETTTRRKN
jgi:hypothetical protein